jgi:hypothetical protein
MIATHDPVTGAALPPAPAADLAPSGHTGSPSATRSLPTFRTWTLAGAGYLALAILLFWHVWSTHPTSTTTCGCGDTSLFTWFLAWPAYAVDHGASLLFSTALFHPTGVNLLSNTGEVALGLVLAPITRWYGPIATLNVALTLSPVLSALAMFGLLRRWVSWAPAAFIGGLAYGFSPVVIISLTDAHLMVAMAPVPPLIVACLDEILVRQVRRAVPVGLLLGALFGLQSFVGTELLVITVITLGTTVILLASLALHHRKVVSQKWRHALVALTAGASAAAILLSYPLWFALAGPAHLSGPVWGAGAPISYVGTVARSFLLPAPAIPIAGTLARRYGGYQAPVLSGQYLGIGMMVVFVVGLVLWRRDRRLQLFATVGALSLALSLGLDVHRWTPWRLFVQLPLMENVIPSRFLVVTYLCAGVLLSLIVDHARIAVSEGRPTALPSTVASAGGGQSRRLRHRLGGAAGLGVAAVALVPWVTYYDAGIPLTTQDVVLPTWFATIAPNLPDHQVVLSFPVPSAFMQSAMTWQAVDRMHYAMASGGGPNGLSSRAGAEAAGQTVLGDLSVADPSIAAAPVTAPQVAAVRHALGGWGVTTAVLPDTAHFPSYVHVYQIRSIVVLLTAATGRQPIRQADAWVWAGFAGTDQVVIPTTAELTRCGAGPAGGPLASIVRAARCVTGQPGAGP